MDNSQDALSALLSDPKALSAALEMAKSVLGNGGAGANPAFGPVRRTTPVCRPACCWFCRIGSRNACCRVCVCRAYGGPAGAAVSGPPAMPVFGKEDDKTKLLLALKPFLSSKRSDKVGTVLMLMRTMAADGRYESVRLGEAGLKLAGFELICASAVLQPPPAAGRRRDDNDVSG